VTFVLLLLLIIGPLSGAPVSATDLSGPWRLEFQQDSASAIYQADCVWEQDGTRVSGSCTSGFESIVSIRGNVQDAHVTFRFTVGTDSGTTMTFNGRLNAQETVIEGTWRFVDAQGQTGGGTFTATKR